MEAEKTECEVGVHNWVVKDMWELNGVFWCFCDPTAELHVRCLKGKTLKK